MKKFYLLALLVAVAIALFLSPLASSSPDGLEKAGAKLGFIEKGESTPAVKAPLPDYQLPGVGHEGLSTSLAGVIGTLLTFLIVWGISVLIYKVKKVKVEKE